MQSALPNIVIQETQELVEGNDSLCVTDSPVTPPSQGDDSDITPKSRHSTHMRSLLSPQELTSSPVLFESLTNPQSDLAHHDISRDDGLLSGQQLDNISVANGESSIEEVSKNPDNDPRSADIDDSSDAAQDDQKPLSASEEGFATIPSLSQIMADIPSSQQDPQMKVLELQKELILTKRSLDEMRKASRVKEDSILALGAQVDMLKESLTQYDLARAKDVTSAQELKRQISSLKKEVTKLTAEKASLAHENEKLKNDNAILWKCDTELKDECQTLKNDNASLQKSNNELKSESEILKKDNATLSQQNQKAVVYFRGFPDPLSAFYACELLPSHGTGTGLKFRSAEHLYHYRRMIAHDKAHIADRVRQANTAAKAKSISERAVPTRSSAQEWLDRAKDEMAEINLIKAQQCPVFRNTLIQTGAARLIHNMESDERWGFGRQGNGLNWMGLALEKVREQITSPLNVSAAPFTPRENATSPNATNPPLHGPTSIQERQRLLVLSDTMLRGAEKFFEEGKFAVDLHAFGGATFHDLTKEVSSVMQGEKPDVVIVHCGTNCVTKSTKSIATQGLRNLIKELKWHSAPKILLSGAVHRLDDTLHNPKIDSINALLKSCESEDIMFVEHNASIKYLRNILSKDGVHLKEGGKRQLIKNIEIALRTGTSSQTEVRKWTSRPVPLHKSVAPKRPNDQRPVTNTNRNRDEQGRGPQRNRNTSANPQMRYNRPHYQSSNRNLPPRLNKHSKGLVHQKHPNRGSSPSAVHRVAQNNSEGHTIQQSRSLPGPSHYRSQGPNYAPNTMPPADNFLPFGIGTPHYPRATNSNFYPPWLMATPRLMMNGPWGLM